MCVIIRKPKNIEVSTDILKLCWNANKDGAGFMYSEDNKLVFKKGLMSFEDFLKEYDACNPIDKEVIIHFRFATHGAIANEQTHPFIIHGNVGVMHNGIINFEDELTGYDCEDDEEEEEEENEGNEENVFDGTTEYELSKESEKTLSESLDKWEENQELEEDEVESDTQIFCSEIMEKLPEDFLNNTAIYLLLSQFLIHNMSVIVLMNNKGEVKIIGDISSQYEEGGCWFSNSNWSNVNKFKTHEFCEIYD